jgi:hypothetical protein
LDNFQNDQNVLSGNAHCDAKNGATLQCARQNNTLRLTYDKVLAGAYGIWWTDLLGAGADLSQQLMLVLQMRGARGGEQPHVYLVDQQGVRAWVELSRYVELTTDWQTIYIPLQDFHDKSGKQPDLAQLRELAIAFEFETQQGSITLAEIRTQDSSFVGPVTHNAAREKSLGDALKLPLGFKASVYVDTHLSQVTRIGFDPQGHFTFARRNGQVYLIEGSQLHMIASGFNELLGFAWHNHELYLASCQKVTRARDTDDDGFYEQTTDLVSSLPCAGHQTNALAFGPDGQLYISQGEFHNQPGALLRLNPNDSRAKPETVATGFRNMYSFVFAPNGDIFGTDNGPDDKAGPDEVNFIVPHGNYGFPDYFGVPPPDSHTLGPLAIFPDHAAAEGITLYTGTQFPRDFQGNLFVALFGQFFSAEVVGHKIVRVKLTRERAEYQAVVSDFATGFERPLDVTVGPDGALYVNEFLSGVIYKITYQPG